MAEAAAEKSKCRTQQFAASGEDDVKHVTQRAVVAGLDRLERNVPSDRTHLCGVMISYGAGDRDEEAKLDVAKGEGQIAGETVHYPERPVRHPFGLYARWVQRKDVERLIVRVSGVDYDREVTGARKA